MARGRKTGYKEEYNDQAYKLCLLGHTNEELAKFFGIALRTFNYWKKQNPDFLHAIKKGKEIADADIAHSLYQRGKGFYVLETSIKRIAGKLIEKKVTKKHYPPDTAAAFIWLKNRTRHTKNPWTDNNENIPAPGKPDKKYL